MSDQQANIPLWSHWASFTAFMTERFLGGPQILKLAWVINFQKTGTFSLAVAAGHRRGLRLD